MDQRILLIRRQRVLVDADLAALYGVPTKALNQAVKRNLERFPSEFAFRLTEEEKDEVVTVCDHLQSLKFSHALPLAFTEHGAIMAANVLNSPRAIQASVFVVRAFIRLREVLATHKELAQKLRELEARLEGHDEDIRALVAAIHALAEPLKTHRRKRIGFRPVGTGK
jgi:hypothetical protein